jgi:GWxTD domain-containing protein
LSIKRRISLRTLESLLLLSLSVIPALGQDKAKPTPMSPAHERWLKAEVVTIITETERDVFLKLSSERERDRFIEAFWRHRDPTPDTPANEFKDEHYRRLSYANANFGRDTTRPGWMTDRGRYYILLGPPRDISSIQGEGTVFASYIWSYDGEPRYGLPAHFQLVFFRRDGVGEYVLYSPMQDGPGRLLVNYQGDPFDSENAYGRLQKYDSRLAQASLSNLPDEISILGRPSLSSEQLLARIGSLPERTVDPKYAESLLKYRGQVDVDYSANYISSDGIIGVFRDANGTFFAHYSIEPKRLSVLTEGGAYRISFTLNGSVADAQGRVIFQYEKNIPLDFERAQVENIGKSSIEIQDMIPLIPGDYSLSVLMKNTVSKEFTSLEGKISIPAESSRLRMGNLLLGYLRKTLPPPAAFNKPFKFVFEEISCQAGNNFLRSETLVAAVQVFGLGGDLSARGALQYAVFRDGREVLSRRKPLSGLSGTDAIEGIPLAELTPANYQLRVSLLDPNGTELAARTENFGITPLPDLSRPWIVSRVMPPSDDPEYAYILGSQSQAAGRPDDAEALFGSAVERRPSSLKYALALAGVLSRKGEAAKVKAVLLPFRESTAADGQLFAYLGDACYSLGEYREALDDYQKNLALAGLTTKVLNAAGECHFRLGEIPSAREAWERSLSLDPNQDAVKKRLAEIRRTGTP